MIKTKNFPRCKELFNAIANIHKTCHESDTCSACKLYSSKPGKCLYDIDTYWKNVIEHPEILPLSMKEALAKMEKSLRNDFLTFGYNASSMCYESGLGCNCDINFNFGICPLKPEELIVKVNQSKYRRYKMATRHLMINRRGEKLDVKKYFD